MKFKICPEAQALTKNKVSQFRGLDLLRVTFLPFILIFLIPFFGISADQIQVIAKEKVDLRGHSLAILRLGFIGRGYTIRETELNYFRNRLAKELSDSGVKVIDNEIVASIQKETIESKKVSSEDIPRAIAEKSKAEFFLAGQALILDRESGVYVELSRITLYRTSDGIAMLELQFKKSEYSVVEFTDTFLQNFRSATNTSFTENAKNEGKSYLMDDNFITSEYIIKEGNLSLFKKVKRNIHLKNSDGESLLTKAIKYNKMEFVRFFVQNKVDVNSCTTAYATNYSELQWAIGPGKIEFVKLLVENGANIRYTCNFGYSPMHSAAMSGDKEILEYLMKKGGDINAKDKQGYTPLGYFVMATIPNIEFVAFLLKIGANPNVLNNDNESPLLTASANKDSLPIVRLMKESGGNIYIQSKQPLGWTPLLWACAKGEVDLYEYLVREGADKNAKSEMHGSCRDVAGKNNHSNILNLLQK